MVETRPSGASRWTKCSAAPLFASLSPPQPDSDPAREGTCAAWVAELVLKGQALRAVDLVGEHHENGWEVDKEMAGHIQSYVDMIKKEGGLIHAERFVRLSPLVAGTLDNSASVLDGSLHVRDLKYGIQLVEADAEQLVIYAGALAAEVLDSGGRVTRIVTEIYQPRGFHHDGIHRRQVWTPAQIFERVNWIAQRAEECHKPNPVATTGPHCVNCAGATGCAALAATADNLVGMVESSRHRLMTATEAGIRLVHLRKAKKIIDAAASALEAEALARHTGGEPITGMGLTERKGHRKFHCGPNTIKALTGIDPFKKSVKTPAELKADGATERQLAALTIKPTIGHKLMPLDPKDLQRQFAKGTSNG